MMSRWQWMWIISFAVKCTLFTCTRRKMTMNDKCVNTQSVNTWTRNDDEREREREEGISTAVDRFCHLSVCVCVWDARCGYDLLIARRKKEITWNRRSLCQCLFVSVLTKRLLLLRRMENYTQREKEEKEKKFSNLCERISGHNGWQKGEIIEVKR